MPSQLSSSWLSANPEFNIRADLTQALIDEQRTYSDKLALQNKELMSTTDGQKYTLATDGKSSNAYGLIPVIYQLDYCIPGPHPGWEEDSQRTLNAVTNLIVSETEESIQNKDGVAISAVASTLSPLAGAIIGSELGSSFPVVGTIIGALVGGAVSHIIDRLSKPGKTEKLRLYYSVNILALTGMMPDYTNGDDVTTANITSKQYVTQGMNGLLDRYIQIMNKTYFVNPEMLPTVAKEAATDFNQLTGYGQMIKIMKTKYLR